MHLEIVNPLNYPGWDDLVSSHEESTIFHSSSWARVLHESYGYKPLYFVSLNKGRLETLIPVMEVDSFLTGKRGVSLPFTDYCCALVLDGDSLQPTMEQLMEYGKKAGWKYLELRGGKGVPDGIAPSSFYYGHTMDLSQGEEKIFPGLRDSTKRNIKKAAKEGVKVDLSRSPEAIEEFYRLNCLTRRMHGLPPQPLVFFKKIYRHVIAQGQGFVSLASHNNQCISGAVYLEYKGEAMYKYGASDKRYQHLRANNLLMWEAIRHFIRNGCKRLSFGRTEPGNKGLLQFKEGWGAKETIISYYNYNFKESAFVKNSLKIKGIHNIVFENMPISLSKIAGSLLYKHMG